MFWYMGFHGTARLNGTMSGALLKSDAKKECWTQVHSHIGGFPGELILDITHDPEAMVASLESQGYSIVRMQEPTPF